MQNNDLNENPKKCYSCGKEITEGEFYIDLSFGVVFCEECYFSMEGMYD